MKDHSMVGIRCRLVDKSQSPPTEDYFNVCLDQDHPALVWAENNHDCFVDIVIHCLSPERDQLALLLRHGYDYAYHKEWRLVFEFPEEFRGQNWIIKKIEQIVLAHREQHFQIYHRLKPEEDYEIKPLKPPEKKPFLLARIFWGCMAQMKGNAHRKEST